MGIITAIQSAPLRCSGRSLSSITCQQLIQITGKTRVILGSGNLTVTKDSTFSATNKGQQMFLRIRGNHSAVCLLFFLLYFINTGAAFTVDVAHLVLMRSLLLSVCLCGDETKTLELVQWRPVISSWFRSHCSTLLARVALT